MPLFPNQIISEINCKLSGLVIKPSWGETAIFYNPGRKLPNGIYFCTIKEHDGTNDTASNLNREGVFRLSIGLTPGTYLSIFGTKPARPGKGGVVDTGHQFDALNEFTPHPIYAWMNWVQILNPTEEKFKNDFYLLEESYNYAILKFNKKLKKN